MTTRSVPLAFLRQPLAWIALGLAAPSLAPAQVNLDWAARYNGPSNVIDQAMALAVDADGNTCVTGSSDRNEPLLGGDIVTLKYGPSGSLIWTARYGHPGGLADLGTAIAVDTAGNVYVTGYSYRPPSRGSGMDYVTLKYAPEGTELWAARYEGPTNNPPSSLRINYPRAIAVDGVGNVYVTGSSARADGEASDYATVKYDASGTELWAAIYDGPAQGNDAANAIAVHGVGEVYVAGTSGLVKYDADGHQLWSRYAVAYALALDPEGNAVTAGADVDERDFDIIKYSPDGNQLWRANYDGAIGESDVATKVRVDSAGNIYATGTSESACNWVRDPDGGEELLCDQVIVTLKLDPQGRQLWAARYQSSQQPSDFPVGLDLDAAGNAYVAGNAWPSMSAVTLKYAPNGTRLWTARYRDDHHGWDTATDLAVSANGNVHVAGHSFWRDGSGDDYFVLKYVQADVPGYPVIGLSPQSQPVARGSNALFTVVATGTEPLTYQWRFNGTVISGATRATLLLTNVQFDQEGDYSVEVGNSAGTVLSPDARLEVWSPLQFAGEPQYQSTVVGATVRFEFRASGNSPIAYQWLFNGAAIPGATHEVLMLTNVQPAQSGVYTLRASNQVSVAISPDAWLRVSPLAQQCWEAQSTTDVSRRWPNGGVIVADTDGSVYVAASRLGVIKYGPAGNALWNTPYPGEVAGIALDTNGSIYVTGFQSDNSREDDYLTVKYSRDGAVLWSRGYNGPANSTDRATGLKVDDAGNVIVTGWASGRSGGTENVHQDFVTIKYSPTGDQLWLATYDSPDHRQDFAYGLAVDHAGNVYVTGEAPAAGAAGWNCTTVKYAPNGAQQWVATYGGVGGDSKGFDIAVDPAGNPCVVGGARALDYRTYGFAVKYDTSGRQLWLATYSSAASRVDFFRCVAVDSAGNVIAGGATARGTAYAYDDLLVKYDSLGNRLWTARYNHGRFAGYSTGIGLALDPADNIYALSPSAVGNLDTFSTLKYDANGNRLWEAQFVTSTISKPGGVAVDAAGNVVAVGGTGLSAYSGTYSRLVTLKYCQNDVPGVPEITQPPQGVSVPAGGSATLTVTATGDAPLSYRWNNGRTGATLALTDLQALDSGDYFVEVDNGLGSVISPVARVTVVAPPALRTPWVTSATFGFTLDGAPETRYAIETSDDLQRWAPLSTNLNLTGLMPLSFPSATSDPPRFFRARWVPQ